MKKLMPLYRIIATESSSGKTLNKAYDWLHEQYPKISRFCVASVEGGDVYNFFSRDRLLAVDGDDVYQNVLSASTRLNNVLSEDGYTTVSDIGALASDDRKLQQLHQRGHRSSFIFAIKSDQRPIGFVFFNSDQAGFFDSAEICDEFLQIAQLIAQVKLYFWRRVTILQQGLKVVLDMGHARDPETEEHLERMSAYSTMIARYMAERNQATNADVVTVRRYARYHDIGKYRIRDDVLFCTKRYTPEQRQIMNQHCQFGHDLLAELEQKMGMVGTNLLTRVKNIILYHHERFDGKGYPCGLSGHEIPIEARIVTVADVFDALLSKRQYKDEWDFERACQFMLDNSGTMFDPNCVAALLAQKDEIQTVRRKFIDADMDGEWEPVH